MGSVTDGSGGKTDGTLECRGTTDGANCEISLGFRPPWGLIFCESAVTIRYRF